MIETPRTMELRWYEEPIAVGPISVGRADVLAGMEADGLLERRGNHLHLTAAGQAEKDGLGPEF